MLDGEPYRPGLRAPADACAPQLAPILYTTRSIIVHRVGIDDAGYRRPTPAENHLKLEGQKAKRTAAETERSRSQIATLKSGRGQNIKYRPYAHLRIVQ